MDRDILENLLLSKYLKIDANKEKVFKIIPELKAEYGFDQKHPHHCFDVWGHTMEALKRSKPDLQIRIALLLHDIGKPYSYQEDGNTRHFRGHPQKSAEISKKVLQRLGYSDDEVDDICYLINNHDTLIDVNKINESKLELTKKLLYIQYCDAYAHHPAHIEKRIEKLDSVLEKLEKYSKGGFSKNSKGDFIMSNERHSEFCKELGNLNYVPNNRTIENQNEFFQRKLGVSREEVVNIEEDKFHKILEGKSGKKIGYDPNIKIDGCTPVMLTDKEER